MLKATRFCFYICLGLVHRGPMYNCLAAQIMFNSVYNIVVFHYFVLSAV